jgi:Winged helix DNA-binding domain
MGAAGRVGGRWHDRGMTRPAADAALPGVLAERYAAQLLSGPPADTAEQVTGHLLAIQAQDLRGARLAIRARSRGLTAADVDQALTSDRSLVVGWLNRGTLHLVRAADYWTLHELTTPQLQATCTRRLAQEGIPAPDADRGAALIEGSLTEHGALTRAQLGERLSAAGIRTEGQALVYLLFLASLRGIAVRGPVIGNEQAFVLARNWLGTPPALDRAAALGWLARRYLAGHAPATERDLAKWAGLALRDARQGLASIAAELDHGGDGLVRLASPASGDGRSPRPGAGRPGVPRPRLLGSFDPVLHGWLSREPVLGPHERKIVLGGMFRPFALVGGHAVGTWTLSRGRVALNLLEDLTAADHAVLRADAADVERFLGTSRLATDQPGG